MDGAAGVGDGRIGGWLIAHFAAKPRGQGDEQAEAALPLEPAAASTLFGLGFAGAAVAGLVASGVTIALALLLLRRSHGWWGNRGGQH